MSEAEFKNTLRRWGLPEAVAGDLAREYGAIGAGHPAFSTPRDTVLRLTARPEFTFHLKRSIKSLF